MTIEEAHPLLSQESHHVTEWKGILLNFVLGGFAVAGTSWLGTFMSPLVGAIFWSYPITILPSLFFMRQQGRNNEYLAKFLVSTTFGLILLMGTTIVLSIIIRHSSQSTASLWIAVAKASGLYILGAIFYFCIVKYCGLSHYFM